MERLNGRIDVPEDARDPLADSSYTPHAPQHPPQRRRLVTRGRLLACARFALTQFSWFLPAIGLIGVILWVIWTRTALVPYWDEWETVVLVQHAQQGQLTLGELWAVHAWSHRLFLPRVVDLALITATHWNRQVEMTFDLAVSIGAALLLYGAIRKTIYTVWLVRLLLVLMPWLVFSLGQFEDWFAPFQLSFMAVLLGAALGVWAVTDARDGTEAGDGTDGRRRRRDGGAPAGMLTMGADVGEGAGEEAGDDATSGDQAKGVAAAGSTAWRQVTGAVRWGRFALLLLGATIATLSAFQGLLIWPAFVPALALRSGRDRRHVALWLGTSVTVWLIYFIGFDFHIQSSSQVTPRAVFLYAADYLGAPVGYPDVARAEVAGLVGMLLLPALCVVYLLLGGRVRQLLPWACLALFVLLCSAATMAGRLCGGAPSAITSRYQIFSALWWVALLVVAGMATEALLHAQPELTWQPARRAAANAVRLWVAQRHHRRLAVLSLEVLAVLALCDGLVVANVAGLGYGLLAQDRQRQHQGAVVYAATASPNCLMIYYPRPDAVRERAAYLKGARLAIFALSERERAQVAGEMASGVAGVGAAAACPDPGPDLRGPASCTTTQEGTGVLLTVTRPNE